MDDRYTIWGFLKASSALHEHCKDLHLLCKDAAGEYPVEWSEFSLDGEDRVPKFLAEFHRNHKEHLLVEVWDTDIAAADVRSSDIAELRFDADGLQSVIVETTAHRCCNRFYRRAMIEITAHANCLKLDEDSKLWTPDQWRKLKAQFAVFRTTHPYDLVHLLPRVEREAAMLRKEFNVHALWRGEGMPEAAETAESVENEVPPILRRRINEALDRLGEDATKESIRVAVKARRKTVFAAIDSVKQERKERRQ